MKIHEEISRKNIHLNPNKTQMNPVTFKWIIPIYMILLTGFFCLTTENIGSDIYVTFSLFMTAVAMFIRKNKDVQRLLMGVVFILMIVYTFLHPIEHSSPFTVMAIVLCVSPFIFKADNSVFKWMGKMAAILGETAIVGRLLEEVTEVDMSPLYFNTFSEGGDNGITIHIGILIVHFGYWVAAYPRYRKEKRNEELT